MSKFWIKLLSGNGVAPYGPSHNSLRFSGTVRGKRL